MRRIVPLCPDGGVEADAPSRSGFAAIPDLFSYGLPTFALVAGLGVRNLPHSSSPVDRFVFSFDP